MPARPAIFTNCLHYVNEETLATPPQAPFVAISLPSNVSNSNFGYVSIFIVIVQLALSPAFVVVVAVVPLVVVSLVVVVVADVELSLSLSRCRISRRHQGAATLRIRNVERPPSDCA